MARNNQLMVITSRQTAIRERRIRYFTGEPCKYGHISERYTKTAGCVDCLHPKFDNGIPRYRAAKKSMVKKRFRVFAENRDAFHGALYAMAFGHEPMMKLSDLEVAGDPAPRCWEGYHLYWFWIFPEDEPMARLLEVPLNSFATPRPVVASPSVKQEWPTHDPN